MRFQIETFITPILLAAFVICAFNLHAEDEAGRLLNDRESGDSSLPFENYSRFKGKLGYRESECETDPEDLPSSPTYGPYKYSCHATHLAHLSDGKNYKFESLACRNGSSENLARHKSMAAADMMVFQEKLDAIEALGFVAQTFTSDREHDHCQKVGGPEEDVGKTDIPNLDSSKDAPSTHSPQHPYTARFTMHNRDRYRVGLEFYSQADKGAWPGGGQQYILSREGSYSLSCSPGEQICYGAWRDYQDVSWGVGRRNENRCKQCCTTCGGDFETTLNDGGADQGPPPAVFTIHNNDRYKVGVRFFARARNVSWPGGNMQYNLVGTQTYRLSCSSGEQICFGAWRDYQTHYWGVGHGGQGCQNCCITCGGAFETTLEDAGADSYPSRNSSGSTDSSSASNQVLDLLGAVLEAAPGVAGALDGGRGVSSRPVSRPAPRNPGSTITGN